jgi:hypothetical protein
MIQDLAAGRVHSSTVSPSTVKATISPRLAKTGVDRSISRLYGACSSPTRVPATNTAKKPDLEAEKPDLEAKKPDLEGEGGRGMSDRRRAGGRAHRR